MWRCSISGRVLSGQSGFFGIEVAFKIMILVRTAHVLSPKEVKHPSCE